MKKGGKVGNSALSSAIKDLEREIRELTQQKSSLHSSLKKVSSSMDVDRSEEKKLQQKIAKLVEKEASLGQKKKKIEAKIDSISDKVGKISKIRSEMSDL